ncbi:glycerate kinase [Corynebacterium sp. H78]|uniref:glycerate kinase n=1 Tax=Corynebacterium sp. H78 TaxID=3133417 RepID=UPI0030B0F70A
MNRDLIVCCPDSFKGTATAQQAARALANGARSLRPRDSDGTWDVVEAPMADGGEGTAELLAGPTGTPHEVATVDAIGRPTTAVWWSDPQGTTCYLDLAAASGLPTVSDAKDPLNASTVGTGLVIRDCLLNAPGITTVVLCLGGSATTDGGAGIVEALLNPTDLAADAADRLHERLSTINWVLAHDVMTPPREAAQVFGPQKGASPEQVDILTARLLAWCDHCGVDPDTPAYGAAGATAVGIAHLCRALGSTMTMRIGADLVARTTGLLELLPRCALLITGEGRIDDQSHVGKVAGYLIDAAKEHNVPVHLVAGEVDREAIVVKQATAWTQLTGPMSNTLADLETAGAEAVQRLCDSQAQEG